MAISQSTTQELNSGISSARRRLQMGYISVRKRRARHNRIFGHCVEDSSRTVGAEVKVAEFREATGD